MSAKCRLYDPSCGVTYLVGDPTVFLAAGWRLADHEPEALAPTVAEEPDVPPPMAAPQSRKKAGPR